MEGCEANNVALTEKHETKKENVDELEKAMKLFNLEDKKDGKEKRK